MPGPKCTIDSSCVIALDHLNLLPNLSLLFSCVLIPKAVRQDLFKRRSMKNRLRSIFKNYAFIQRCDEYEPGAVAFLLAERVRQGMKDRGEAEAVAQASQTGATVIVDDRWGRELAVSISIITARFGCSRDFTNWACSDHGICVNIFASCGIAAFGCPGAKWMPSYSGLEKNLWAHDSSRLAPDRFRTFSKYGGMKRTDRLPL